MFTKSTSASVKTFFIFVFLLLAGGVIAVISLQVSKSDSQDIRSRAANPETIVKEWDFTKGSTLGWRAESGASVSVPPQKQIYPTPPSYLLAQYSSNGTELTNNDQAPRIVLIESLQAPVGMKKFRIWLRVSVPSIQQPSGASTSVNKGFNPKTPQPPPKTVPFKFSVQYLKKSGSAWNWSKIASFNGTTEQGFQEFVIPWEDSLPLQTDRLRLVFNRLDAKAPVQIQIQKIQIAVEQTPALPTATPTPASSAAAVTGIVRQEIPPSPTASARMIMIAQAPNYVLVAGSTTYVLTFDTKSTVTPTIIKTADGAAIRGGGGGLSAGAKLYYGMGALVGCQVSVTGATVPNVGTRPAILVSSVSKTGSCGL